MLSSPLNKEMQIYSAYLHRVFEEIANEYQVLTILIGGVSAFLGIRSLGLTAKSHLIATMPYPIISYERKEDENDPEHEFIVKNEGKGLAHQLIIEPLEIYFKHMDANWKLQLDPIDILESGKKTIAKKTYF